MCVGGHIGSGQGLAGAGHQQTQKEFMVFSFLFIPRGYATSDLIGLIRGFNRLKKRKMPVHPALLILPCLAIIFVFFILLLLLHKRCNRFTELGVV
jgi:hypothetical protein